MFCIFEVYFGSDVINRQHTDSGRNNIIIPQPKQKIPGFRRVYGWRAYFSILTPVTFQIWRPRGGDQFKLVNESAYQPVKTGVNTVDLSMSVRFLVQTNDLIGLHIGHSAGSVVFDYTTKKCGKKSRPRFLNLDTQPIVISVGSSYGLGTLPLCRLYSFQVFIGNEG